MAYMCVQHTILQCVYTTTILVVQSKQLQVIVIALRFPHFLESSLFRVEHRIDGIYKSTILSFCLWYGRETVNKYMVLTSSPLISKKRVLIPQDVLETRGCWVVTWPLGGDRPSHALGLAPRHKIFTARS